MIENYYKKLFLAELLFLFIVILIWFIYGINYRYSEERIGNKILTKYKINPTLEKDNFPMIADNSMKLSNDKSSVEIVINLINKNTGDITSSELIKWNISNNCHNLLPNCIKL
jgi:hypothetical protein